MTTLAANIEGCPETLRTGIRQVTVPVPTTGEFPVVGPDEGSILEELTCTDRPERGVVYGLVASVVMFWAPVAAFLLTR